MLKEINFIFVFFMIILAANLVYIIHNVMTIKREAKHIDGVLHVGEHDGKDSYTLEIITPLEKVEQKDTIKLEIRNHKFEHDRRSRRE